jgi:prophage antirepressor-like protein
MDNLNIMTIGGVECYEQDGIVYLRLTTVARGLGFTRLAESGNEVIRWERVNKYLSEFGCVPTRGHDGEYIPENVFYRLAMKAKNEAAEKFQALVADEIIPSIRKTGGYQQKPMTQLEIIAAQAQALVDHERRMNAIEETTKALDEKIDAAADAFMAPSFSVETWRTETKASISAIVEAEKLSYGIYTGELYKKLENVAGCNLADRQTRMKNRMRKEGATASQCSMVTKLYIISLDQKLRAIFDHIMVQEKASRLMKGGIAHA